MTQATLRFLWQLLLSCAWLLLEVEPTLTRGFLSAQLNCATSLPLHNQDLRGDFHDMRNSWNRFHPKQYHSLEEVTSGRRASLALFSPRSWTRIPQHALNELQDVGLYPPRTVNHASAASPAGIEPPSQDQDRSEADKPMIMTSPSSEEDVGLPCL